MKIRIYTTNTLLLHKTVLLNEEQTHYITKVMRLGVHDEILLFNKESGEFLCSIQEVSKKHSVCKIVTKIRDFQEPEIHLTCVFSIIKPKNVELIIQKCTEIGVTEFIPLETTRTNDSKLNIERLQKIIIEASEQCGRLDIPKITEIMTIKELMELSKNGGEFILLHQDGINYKPTNNKRLIIIGPEGGFSEKELKELENFTQKVQISKNILRAETAAILGCGIFLL